MLGRLVLMTGAAAVAAAAVDSSPDQATPGYVTDAPDDSVRSVPYNGGFLVPYAETIPGTDAEFTMLPVPGGVVRLPVHGKGEEPAYCEVELPPFWVGEHEVSWSEFKAYMALDLQYSQLGQLAAIEGGVAAASGKLLKASQSTIAARSGESIAVDAVTAPTPLYDPATTYESGDEPDLPAVTMTPFAARQYTKWLSALLGRDYRLPSEAEWIHVATAGEETQAPAGEELDTVAWHVDNSDYVAQPVGTKPANAWGAHDTLGNVAEMVLDALRPEGRPELAGKRVGWSESIAWPAKGDRRIAKGGWWDAEAEELNYEGRMVTDPNEWKLSDPNLPASPWWYADYPSTGVGFRIVRPAAPIPDELKMAIWDTADDVVAAAVRERLREGRGKIGPIGSDLPAIWGDLDDPAVQKALR